MLKEGYKECPFCGEIIKENAIKCKHCASMLDGSKLKPYLDKKDITIGVGILLMIIGCFLPWVYLRESFFTNYLAYTCNGFNYHIFFIKIPYGVIVLLSAVILVALRVYQIFNRDTEDYTISKTIRRLETLLPVLSVLFLCIFIVEITTVEDLAGATKTFFEKLLSEHSKDFDKFYEQLDKKQVNAGKNILVLFKHLGTGFYMSMIGSIVTYIATCRRKEQRITS
ncbi:MAG: hypothetical protein KAV83_08070 [Desulfobacterales bacterium]|nr:hypothetical protein [Desulfobacterales bacterium]